MGFSWTNISDGVVITADQYIEMKDACDTVATDVLDIPIYSWTSNSDVSKGNLITADSFNEMRDAVDYLDNNNTCESHNGSYFGINNNSDDSNHDEDENSSHYDSHDDVDYFYYWSSDLSYHYDDVDSDERSSYFAVNRSNYDGVYMGTNMSTVTCDSEYASVNSGENSTVYDGFHALI